MNKETRQVFIPFCGFYNSVFDAAIDSYLEQEADYFIENTNLNENEVIDKIQTALNYGKALHDISKAYPDYFASLLYDESDIKINLKFLDLISPRYYNFTTDQILAEISLDDVYKIYSAVDKKILADVVKERHTSYDGFISFYDNNVNNWGNIESWDCNQLETLLIAFIGYTGIRDFDMQMYWQYDDMKELLRECMDDKIINELHSKVKE